MNFAVTSPVSRSATHNRPLSDGGHGSVGSGNRTEPRQRPGNDPGQTREHRFKWSDQLRRDILTCWQNSSPTRRGFMQRLHERWVNMHPEYAHKTPQYLRDQVSFLRKNGYEALYLEQQNPPANMSPVPARPPLRITDNDNMRTRRSKIHQKVFLRMDKLAEANSALPDLLPEDVNLWTLNCVVYEKAVTLLSCSKSNDTLVSLSKTRERIAQLQFKIETARRHASNVQCVISYITSNKKFTPKVRALARNLRKANHTLNKCKLLTIKQHWTQKIRALSTAKERLERRVKWIQENSTFSTQPSRLFNKTSCAVKNPPSREEIKVFWEQVYGDTYQLNEDASDISLFRNFCQRQMLQRPEEECPPITAEEVKKVIARTKNFSAPGPDKINNFWWKKFTSTHQHLARIFTTFLNGEQPVPQWLVEGRTILIPKTGDLSSPKNYRPIACLNTSYKLFTGILKDRILTSIEPVWSAIVEQRGCKRGLAGCRENLLIDRCITQDSIRYRRNLSMAWIDYRKAFDNTNHELLIKLLECLEVHPKIVRCIKELMLLWRTRFVITFDKKQVTTSFITYKRGVFQGDSLSPILFCISLLPLSIVLRGKSSGYLCGPPNRREFKVNHLLYMDDLKLFASSKKDLNILVAAVNRYSKAIGMSFGLDKCACVHLRQGRLETTSSRDDQDVQLIGGNTIQHLGNGETYTYLGIPQAGTQDVRMLKTALEKRYRQTLRKIWASELSGKNKIQATNMLAVPILLYTFGAVKWNVDELKQLDRSTRKMMTIHRSHHPRSSVPRIYLPRDKGGRGLLSLECLHRRIVLATACSVLNSTDSLMRLVHQHEVVNAAAFLYGAADRAAEELGLPFNSIDTEHGLASLTPLVLKSRVREAEHSLLLREHAEKPLHGQFYGIIRREELSMGLSNMFLKSAGLRSETEGFLFACQDGVIDTLVYRERIMNVPVGDTNCRACKQEPETLGHVLSGCLKYARYGYIERHNAALKVLYYHLRHFYGVDITPVLPYAQGELESVVENDQCKIYWNFSFSTIQRISATKPDIVLQDLKTKIIYVIEFSAPADNNITTKEEEKRAKYQALLFELSRLYQGYKVHLVVLIIGCLGGMKASFLSQLNKIPACQRQAQSIANRMQKAVLLGSLHLVRQHCSL